MPLDPASNGPDVSALQPEDRAKILPRRLPLAAPPELVPARMVNETLYCERLLYLEWAQGEFVDNAFHHDEDQVLFVDVGPEIGRGVTSTSSLGRAYVAPEQHAVVV